MADNISLKSEVPLRDFIKFVGLVFGLQIAYAFILICCLSKWEERSSFGEMFGGINTFFSGLAFAGLLYTILVQQSEIQSQKQELERTLQIQSLSVRVLSLTGMINAHHSMLELETQNLKYAQSMNSQDAMKSHVDEITRIKGKIEEFTHTIETLNANLQ